MFRTFIRRWISDPDEVRGLLKHVDEPCRTIIQLAAMTGMRRGEIFGLQWGDIDWNNNTIRVRRNLFLAGEEGIAGRVQGADVVLSVAQDQAIDQDHRHVT